jgi:hypothetical protein
MGLAFHFEADHSHLNFQGELRHGLCRTHVICEILCNCAEIDICQVNHPSLNNEVSDSHLEIEDTRP